jgi:hypothetical protein
MNNERKRWHMAVDTLLAQPAREVPDAKDNDETDNRLREFGKCAVALRNVLHQDRTLNEVELLFIENHFQVLQMAYLRWKRKHRDDLQYKRAVPH